MLSRRSSREGYPGCGDVAAVGCEPTLAQRVEEEVLKAIRRRWRSAAGIRRLKRELARVTEELHIKNKSHLVFRQGYKVRYLTVVIDLFSRLSSADHRSHVAALCDGGVASKDEGQHSGHFDQGSQFTSMD